MQLRFILQQIPDPRGKQGRDYRLWSLLALIVVSMLSGRRGMKAAFLLGRSLTRRQKAQLGFVSGATPCHATLTETLRIIDARTAAAGRNCCTASNLGLLQNYETAFHSQANLALVP
jgi:hypothetical protein